MANSRFVSTLPTTKSLKHSQTFVFMHTPPPLHSAIDEQSNDRLALVGLVLVAAVVIVFTVLVVGVMRGVTTLGNDSAFAMSRAPSV